MSAHRRRRPPSPRHVTTNNRALSAAPRAIAAVIGCFVLGFSLLEINSFSRRSATWDEPIHLTAGYVALVDGDHRVDPTHPPFLRMWAALPLLTMGPAGADSSVID